MKTFILVLIVFAALISTVWAEKIELPPCKSFDFCYRIVLDTAGWKPADEEPQFKNSCENIGDTCTVVGEDFWAQCKVKSTILKPDVPLYYWTLHRKDKAKKIRQNY